MSRNPIAYVNLNLLKAQWDKRPLRTNETGLHRHKAQTSTVIH